MKFTYNEKELTEIIKENRLCCNEIDKYIIKSIIDCHDKDLRLVSIKKVFNPFIKVTFKFKKK